MRLSSRIKPIGYLKTHTAEIGRTLADSREPFIITQHAKAKVVAQDVDSYEQTQELLVPLKILALSGGQIEGGRPRPTAKSLQRFASGARLDNSISCPATG